MIIRPLWLVSLTTILFYMGQSTAAATAVGPAVCVRHGDVRLAVSTEGDLK